MQKQIHTSRIEWIKGVHFILISEERPIRSTEVDAICGNYFNMHRTLTLSGEALFVDLRPAFAIPLSNVLPKDFRAVPLNYTPPLVY